jgi:hypothetical protein
MFHIKHENVNSGAFAGTPQKPPSGSFFKNAKTPLSPLSGVSGA